ncbi:membrane protein [Streptomyces cirratus]|uniref:Membrane protein n=1 Tax=Streptomyces cirratus TaxID=68187 RepID=A0ABQ3EX08_9ACTN|nr:TIGR02611 family protein [Streptomyces cirratus]GHB62724.1 membrane protein [Streptomyces cirratus]
MNTGSDRETNESAQGGADSEAQPHVSKAPAFVKANRSLHLSWQIGVFVVGLAVIAAGVAMLVLPGPGWVAIFAGLFIWGTEFAWAQVVLRWTKRKVAEAAQKAMDPRVRRRNLILTGVGFAVAAALIGFYLWKYGFMLPWNIKDQ